MLSCTFVGHGGKGSAPLPSKKHPERAEHKPTHTQTQHGVSSTLAHSQAARCPTVLHCTRVFSCRATAVALEPSASCTAPQLCLNFSHLQAKTKFVDKKQSCQGKYAMPHSTYTLHAQLRTKVLQTLARSLQHFSAAHGQPLHQIIPLTNLQCSGPLKFSSGSFFSEVTTYATRHGPWQH